MTGVRSGSVIHQNQSQSTGNPQRALGNEERCGKAVTAGELAAPANVGSAVHWLSKLLINRCDQDCSRVIAALALDSLALDSIPLSGWLAAPCCVPACPTRLGSLQEEHQQRPGRCLGC